MFEEKPTGKLTWERETWGWDLRQEIDYYTPLGTIRLWSHTHWWIYRFVPLWPYEVLYSAKRLKVVKRFWSLRKAKAFAEVMHLMGVRYE